MKKTCKHCNSEIEYVKHQQFGAHLTNCDMNPKKLKIKEKRSETKKLNCKIYEITCLYCNKIYELGLSENMYNKDKYRKCCCKSCSSKYSQSFVNRDCFKQSKCKKCGVDMKIKLNASINNSKCCKCQKKICKICGQEECIYPDMCKFWYKGGSKSFIKFGFNLTKVGTIYFYDEYYRIVMKLKNEYKTDSMVEIGEKYNINYQTVYMLFKRLNIKTRNNSESGRLAIKKGRQSFSDTPIYPYKSCYHVSWEGKKYWLRSSYELEYAKLLDDGKIKYEVESLRIQYFDTNIKTERTSIPDFYLVDTNELVEIKSSWTYDEQNMLDKIKSYKENGYNFKLILDKEEVYSLSL